MADARVHRQELSLDGVLGAGRCKRFSAFVEEVTFHFLAVMPRVKRFVVVDVDIVDVVFGAVLSHE